MKEDILSLEKDAMERWRNGDPGGFVEISAPDLTYFDPALSAPIVGLESFKVYMKGLEGKVHYQGSEFLNPRVEAAGDGAVLSYNYRSSVIAPEGTTTRQNLWNATEVYFLRGGKWRIVHTHWSYVGQRLPEELEVPVPVQLSRKEYDGVLGELMALESAAMERWRKGDPWGFTDISAPQVTYLDTGTPRRIDGLEALKSEYALRERKIFYDVMDFIAPRVQVCAEMAALSYRFLSTRLNPDGSVSQRTPWNCSEVFVRLDGRWRIVHTHWSYIKGERQAG
jgi:ketosteroid isomerase-like protein